MRYVLSFTLVMAAFAAGAQQPPGTQEATSPQDIEPAVTTSSSALPTPSTPASAPAASATAANPAATDKAPGPATPAAAPAKAPAPGKAATKSTAHDQIQLDTTKITGNSELPNVMYVVPWKRPELGDLGGRPAKSLVDEALAPVDRDVFRRQNRYFTALQADSAPRPAPPPAPAGSGTPPPGG
jgi:hypothetical protein